MPRNASMRQSEDEMKKTKHKQKMFFSVIYKN